MFHVGVLVPQNYSHASYWYEKAAIQGYVPSSALLGDIYINGDGNEFDDDNFEQSYFKAYIWLSLAWRQGHQIDIVERYLIRCKQYLSAKDKSEAAILITKKLEIIKANEKRSGTQYQLKDNKWVPIFDLE